MCSTSYQVVPQQRVYAQIIMMGKRRPLAHESGLAQKCARVLVDFDCLVSLLAPQLCFDNVKPMNQLRGTPAVFEIEFIQVQ